MAIAADRPLALQPVRIHGAGALPAAPRRKRSNGDTPSKSPKNQSQTWQSKCVYVLPVKKSIVLIIAPVETARNRETTLRSTPN